MNAEYYERGRQLALKLAETNDEFMARIAGRAGVAKPEAASRVAVKPPSPPVSPVGTPRGSSSQLGGASERQALRREAGI